MCDDHGPTLKGDGAEKIFWLGLGARTALPDGLVAGGLPVAAPAGAALTY